MIGLTQVQANCLSFLQEYSNANGIMPTMQEIADHFGWVAKSHAHRTLERLQERGYIRMGGHRARAIEIIPEAERRLVLVSETVWSLLIAYCVKEHVSVETAVAQFVRDGIENA